MVYSQTLISLSCFNDNSVTRVVTLLLQAEVSELKRDRSQIDTASLEFSGLHIKAFEHNKFQFSNCRLSMDEKKKTNNFQIRNLIAEACSTQLQLVKYFEMIELLTVPLSCKIFYFYLGNY